MHPPSRVVEFFLGHCLLWRIDMTDMDVFDNEHGTTLHWVRQSVFCDISPGFEFIYRVHKVGRDPTFSSNMDVALAALIRVLAS